MRVQKQAKTGYVSKRSVRIIEDNRNTMEVAMKE